MTWNLSYGVEGDQALADTQMKQQQIQMNDLTIADTQRKQEQAQRDEQLQQTALAMASKISQGKGGVGSSNNDGAQATSLADTFKITAEKLMTLGAPKLAMDYYKNAATINKDEQALAKDRADTAKSSAEATLKQADIVGEKLGSAQSAEQWNQGLLEMQQSGAFTPEQIQHFAAIPYHPAAVAHLRDAALTVKDKADLQIKQADQDFNVSRAQSEDVYRAAQLSIDRARLEEEKRKNQIDKKTGATAPTSEQVKSAKAAIVQTVFQGTPPENTDALEAGSFDIASRAQDLVRNNKGLSWQTAINRAVAESDQAGDWEVHKGGWFSDDTTTFSGVGKTPDDAMPLPDKPTPDSLKKGRWYITAKGRGQWDGENFNIPE